MRAYRATLVDQIEQTKRDAARALAVATAKLADLHAEHAAARAEFRPVLAKLIKLQGYICDGLRDLAA